jgi:hypothetical protein
MVHHVGFFMVHHGIPGEHTDVAVSSCLHNLSGGRATQSLLTETANLRLTRPTS